MQPNNLSRDECGWGCQRICNIPSWSRSASLRMRLWSKRIRCFRFLWANPEWCPRAVATTLVSSAGVEDLSNQKQTQGAEVFFVILAPTFLLQGANPQGVSVETNRNKTRPSGERQFKRFSIRCSCVISATVLMQLIVGMSKMTSAHSRNNVQMLWQIHFFHKQQHICFTLYYICK